MEGRTSGSPFPIRPFGEFNEDQFVPERIEVMRVAISGRLDRTARTIDVGWSETFVVVLEAIRVEYHRRFAPGLVANAFPAGRGQRFQQPEPGRFLARRADVQDTRAVLEFTVVDGFQVRAVTIEDG